MKTITTLAIVTLMIGFLMTPVSYAGIPLKEHVQSNGDRIKEITLQKDNPAKLISYKPLILDNRITMFYQWQNLIKQHLKSKNHKN